MLSALGAGAAPASASPPLRWSKPVVVDHRGALGAVSCPTTKLCVAVDVSGKVLTSTNPGATWRVVPGVHLNVFLEDSETDTLYDLSCPSRSLCVSGSGAGIAYSTNPLGGKRAWRFTPDVANGFVSALSCASSHLCVGSGTTSRNADLIGSGSPQTGTWNVIRQHLPASGNDLIGDISCPTASLCVAAGDYQQLYTSTAPLGTGWHQTASLAHQITGISCPSAKLCVSFDDQSRIAFSTHPTGGTAAWHQTRLKPLGLNFIDCPSATLCVATGTGAIAESTDPTGGSRAWRIVNVPGRLNSVSCPSSKFCVAVGDGGRVRVGREP